MSFYEGSGLLQPLSDASGNFGNLKGRFTFLYKEGHQGKASIRELKGKFNLMPPNLIYHLLSQLYRLPSQCTALLTNFKIQQLSMSQFYSPARGLVPNLDIPSTETIILTTNFTIQHLSVSKIYRLAFVDEPVLPPNKRPCAPPLLKTLKKFEKTDIV